MDRVNQSIPTVVILSSILLGLYLNLACIAVYLFPSAEGGTDSGGVLGILYIIIIAALFIVSLIKHKIMNSGVNRYTILSVVYILIFYYYSTLIYPEPRTSFDHFIVFTIVSMILPSIIKVNIRWVLLSVIFSTIPALFRLRTIFFSMVISYTSDDILSQGYSYAFLTPAVCTLVYIKYFLKLDSRKKNALIINALIIIAIIINLIFAFLLIQMGSRGPVFALISLIAIPIIFEIKGDMNGVKIKKLKLLLFLFLIIIVVVNFVPILTFIHNLLSEFGLSLHFIDKFIIRNDLGDMASERDTIFDMAMKGIYNHPWFGNGFDQFYNNTGRGYPHNFIIQTFYDGGVFLFSATLLPVLIFLKKWFAKCDYKEYVIILFLFFASVPGALFSHDLWEISNLWFFYGAILNYNKLVYS